MVLQFGRARIPQARAFFLLQHVWLDSAAIGLVSGLHCRICYYSSQKNRLPSASTERFTLTSFMHQSEPKRNCQYDIVKTDVKLQWIPLSTRYYISEITIMTLIKQWKTKLKRKTIFLKLDRAIVVSPRISSVLRDESKSLVGTQFRVLIEQIAAMKGWFLLI